MIIRSFYTKVILTLSGVFLTLFLVQGLSISLIFRGTVVDVLKHAEEGRFISILNEINRIEFRTHSRKKIQEFIHHLYLEGQIDVYDSTGVWSIGNQLFFPPEPTLSGAIDAANQQFTGFSTVYYSTLPHPVFPAIRVTWRSQKKPVFWQAILVLAVSGLITLLVTFAVGYKLSSSLNLRLIQLEKGVAQVARGNFQVELELPGNDEIAELGRNFNRMARQIRDLIDQLEESNEARQRLIAHASHEIKSPLTSIQGFVDIIEYMQLIPEQGEQSRTVPTRELLNTVRKDIKRVIKIADDLIQLARLQEANFHIEKKEVSLRSVLKEEHRYFVHKAREHNATALLKFSGRTRYRIETDPIRLAQILDNLWSNALKYGDLSHPIVTRVHEENGWISITVSNYLIYPLEVSPHQLFEPFYRDPKFSEHVKGSGLGLAIVQELVNRMGGRIKSWTEEKQLFIAIYFPKQVSIENG